MIQSKKSLLIVWKEPFSKVFAKMAIITIGENKYIIDEVYFRSQIIEWGRENFRSFPWRFTKNPYHILIAELLLHRTQAKQVEPVYLEFVKTYPNVLTLFHAKKGEISEIVKSLGLFWRSELIQTAAEYLVEKYNGEIPVEKELLIEIPGVGHYVASAVRCFAYGLPDAIIDTNVVRVITRVTGITPNDSLRRNKLFMEFAQKLVDPVEPQRYNFAILDLADKICLPKHPDHEECPLKSICSYEKYISKT